MDGEWAWWRGTYDLGWLFDGVAPEGIAEDFDGATNDDGGEEPGAVLDDGEVENGGEDNAVQNGGEYGDREGWIVWPDGGRFVGHVVGDDVLRWAWLMRKEVVLQ